MNIQDVGQLVFVFVLLVVRCKTFSNHSYKTSGFGFFRNLDCHSFLNPSITFLAHQIQRFKWGFPVTCHQSSVNFHILILNFLSITTRRILDVILLWCSSSKIVSGDRFLHPRWLLWASDWLKNLLKSSSEPLDGMEPILP